jgi:hypothetical protein
MSMYRDSCAREGFKADLRHPDALQNKRNAYGMNDNGIGMDTLLPDYDIVQYYLYRYRTNT